jgi:branched-chain amino acid transport system ATP-binding protein
MSLLKISKLTKSFGGVTALSDLDLEVNEQEIVGLIGSNGSGKTTLFNTFLASP